MRMCDTALGCGSGFDGPCRLESSRKKYFVATLKWCEKSVFLHCFWKLFTSHHIACLVNIESLSFFLWCPCLHTCDLNRIHLLMRMKKNDLFSTYVVYDICFGPGSPPKYHFYNLSPPGVQRFTLTPVKDVRFVWYPGLKVLAAIHVMKATIN